MGITVEGLQAVGNLTAPSATELAAEKMGQDQTSLLKKQKAAQLAAEQFKSGDMKGSIGTLLASDPEHAANFLKGLVAMDPNLQGALAQSKTAGALKAQNELGSGSIAVTVAGINAAAKKDAGNRPVIRASSISPSGQTITENGVTRFTELAGDQVASGEAAKNSKPLQSFQDVDSNGMIVSLTKDQRDTIKDARKSFDGETKELVKAIDSAHQAQIYIDKNIPMSGTIEKLRLLKSVVQGRVTNQELQQMGTDLGVFDQAANQLSIKGGKGMSKGVQDKLRQIVDIALKTTTQEYDQRLKNAVERNPNIDSLILKKRLVGSSGPTVYQDLTKKVEQLPPDAQALFNWAHDHPDDPKAAGYIQQLHDKFGLQ